MHCGVEELAERIEEKQARHDPGENFELGIVVLEMHQLMRDDGFHFVFLKEFQESR